MHWSAGAFAEGCIGGGKIRQEPLFHLTIVGKEPAATKDAVYIPPGDDAEIGDDPQIGQRGNQMITRECQPGTRPERATSIRRVESPQ